MSTRAEISGGAFFSPWASTQASPLSAFDDLVGHHVDVFLHDVVVELAADEALDREQRVLRIGDRLALGRLADQDFVVLGERDDRRRGAITLAVLDDARLAAFHDGDAGIGGSQIDADYLAHTNLHSLFLGIDPWPLSGGQVRSFQENFLNQLFGADTITRAGRSNLPFNW